MGRGIHGHCLHGDPLLLSLFDGSQELKSFISGKDFSDVRGFCLTNFKTVRTVNHRTRVASNAGSCPWNLYLHRRICNGQMPVENKRRFKSRAGSALNTGKWMTGSFWISRICQQPTSASCMDYLDRNSSPKFKLNYKFLLHLAIIKLLQRRFEICSPKPGQTKIVWLIVGITIVLGFALHLLARLDLDCLFYGLFA